MYATRVASLCVVLVMAAAPIPAFAQNTLAARVTALEEAVDRLMGNIRPRDLIGTYNVYLLGVAMDPPGTEATHNQMASYVMRGTATFTGTPRRGTLDMTFDGIVVTEQAADQNWTHQPAGGSGTGGFSWAYNNGFLTITMDPGVPFNDFTLSVVAGGRALVGAVGGAPSNNQQLVVLVRQP
jgi:hypothetical protein